MNETSFKLIKELTELQGISGNEGRVRAYLREHMTPLVDEIQQSPLDSSNSIR